MPRFSDSQSLVTELEPYLESSVKSAIVSNNSFVSHLMAYAFVMFLILRPKASILNSHELCQ